MSVLGAIGLAAAERLERSVGAGTALRSYKLLLGGSERTVRLRAALGAFRCALELADELELAAVAAYWETLVDVEGEDAIAHLVQQLLVAGRGTSAVIITEAEVRRRPTPSALYRHARSLELAGRDAEDEFRRCAELAPEGALRCAAQSKQLAAMVARDAPLEDVLVVAEAIDMRVASPPQKLLAARVRLRSPSRFVRAAALSACEELGASADRAVARRAVKLAAAHADDMGEALSWVEADRVRAALSSWPVTDERNAALARLGSLASIASSDNPDAVVADAAGLEPAHRDYLEHARATLAGEAHSAALDVAVEGEIRHARRCLHIIDRLRGREWQRAEREVRELVATCVAEPQAIPRAAWVVARMALSVEGVPALPVAGLELSRVLLEATSRPPGEGYVAFAGAASRLGAHSLAEALLRRAVRHGEPDARAWLVAELARYANEAAARSEPAAALALLREAKALMEE